MLAPHHKNTAILSVRLMQQAKRPAHLVAQRDGGRSVGLRLAQLVGIANRDAQLAAGLGPRLDASGPVVGRAKVLGEDCTASGIVDF